MHRTADHRKTPAAMAKLLVSLMLALFGCSKPPRTISPPNESEVALTAVENGVIYKLYQAALWRVNPHAGTWEFVQEMYDPDFYAKHYAERDGKIYRKVPESGKLVPVRRELADGFEHARPVRELLSLETGWTGFTLQAPRAPTVSDYVRLRQRILQGESGFLDNRVELTGDIVHSGQQALKTLSVPPARSMVCAKASLESELLHFVRGDNVWFSGWFYVPAESAMPFTIMDLETTWIREHPGIRLMLGAGKHAMFELKWGTKRTYRQPPGKEIAFPIAKWVHLQSHLKLSAEPGGIVQLWQDGAQIIDERGQTLPLSDTIYNSLEIGITAHIDPIYSATLYVDDVRIADRPGP